MMLSLTQSALGLASGSLVGFTLGLVGGGGSILAVPLLVYLVGVTNPHVAIGTSAIAVAANAAANLANHARAGNVKWRCALVFSVAGVVGAFGGSTLGKAVDGQKLLALFAVVMMAVGTLMLRKRGGGGEATVRLSRENFPKLVGIGLATGALSGFFGIGGGFLIVPGLILATGMPILYAVGSSLVAVTAFGLTTAANYAFSGLVDWTLAALFIGGGVIGGLLGARSAARLAGRKGALNTVFATLIFAVAAYMLVRSLNLA
ncbi:sulfite exporter TauE/SafE family protein [Microvirga thermotolerans]|uniref:Probable membrane transporter protein n=1 Tax=Microvirga thermotolerans TaxID=2651334 RepID=A0A5P9JWA1_9HYPH|nr:sulfite exporter TauE/SafE family protein [Microvirga thermotolerans]QFU16713.1 TSUP family transporter [Microvirga thermotolerans]